MVYNYKINANQKECMQPSINKPLTQMLKRYFNPKKYQKGRNGNRNSLTNYPKKCQ